MMCIVAGITVLLSCCANHQSSDRQKNADYQHLHGLFGGLAEDEARDTRAEGIHGIKAKNGQRNTARQ
jgi:hypothetical protein